MSKNYEEALRWLESSIVLEPKAGEPFDLAADAAFRLGQHAKGKRLAKEAQHRGVFVAFKHWQDGVYGPS
jgi:hypothetical protein